MKIKERINKFMNPATLEESRKRDMTILNICTPFLFLYFLKTNTFWYSMFVSIIAYLIMIVVIRMVTGTAHNITNRIIGDKQ